MEELIKKEKERALALQREYAEYEKHYRANPDPDNPSSPYAPSKSPPLITASDKIRYRQFIAKFSEHYAPLPDVILSGEIEPIYVPIRGCEYSEGGLTISGMMDLIDMGETFELRDSNDLLIIKQICIDYLDEVPEEVHLTSAEKFVIDRIKKFLRIITDSINKSQKLKAKTGPNIKDLLTRIIKG